jgi:hypothetical protein
MPPALKQELELEVDKVILLLNQILTINSQIKNQQLENN